MVMAQMGEVGDESTQVPYQVTEDGGNVKIKCPNAGKDFAPEEISAQVLRKLCADAAKFLNDKVRRLRLRGAPDGRALHARVASCRMCCVHATQL